MLATDKKYKAILKKKSASDLEGFIVIRETSNRKNTTHSLNIKIDAKLWNTEKSEVRKTTVIDYKQINSIIKSKITELEATQTVKVNRLSFTDYFNKYIGRINNEGSKIKYEQVLNKLNSFKANILYTDINPDFIYALQTHLLKKQVQNTTNHYLKLVNQVLNKAIKEKQVVYLYHPFNDIEYKYTAVQKNALNSIEIEKLINTYIEPTDFEYNTRNKFLFQIFSQGMRISDLMLLKWENIQAEKINYTMFKTGKQMKVELNDILLVILIFQYKEFIQRNYIRTPELNSLEQELDELIDSRNKHLATEHNIVSGFDNLTREMFDFDEHTVKYYDRIDLVKQQIYLTYLNHIDYLSKDPKHKSKHVFDFVDFEIKNVKKITETEYKKLKNKSIVYNRQLKALQKKVGSTINFKSHLSRHTYASLLLNSGTNLFVIAQSLGHSRIAITEKYLTGFSNDKTNEANREIANQFKGFISR